MARKVVVALVWLVVAPISAAMPSKLDPVPSSLADAMRARRVVLLGEVHDNASQHALRAAALRRVLESGARPAVAFEQFDREHQAAIDRARSERPGDADYVISQGGGDSAWRWNDYRPFVMLALDYDLPIVAANLSRKDAMRVATAGWSAVFDRSTITKLELESLPDDFLRKHLDAIAAGHCNRLAPESLIPTARAQIARDIAIERAIEPYFHRGIVLLAGNGHVRRDIGVPHWLPADVAHNALSIGLLERGDDGAAPESVDRYDLYVVTEAAARDDPCNQISPPTR